MTEAIWKAGESGMNNNWENGGDKKVKRDRNAKEKRWGYADGQ